MPRASSSRRPLSTSTCCFSSAVSAACLIDGDGLRDERRRPAVGAEEDPIGAEHLRGERDAARSAAALAGVEIDAAESFRRNGPSGFLRGHLNLFRDVRNRAAHHGHLDGHVRIGVEKVGQRQRDDAGGQVRGGDQQRARCALSPGRAIVAGLPASGLASPKYGFEAPTSG